MSTHNGQNSVVVGNRGSISSRPPLSPLHIHMTTFDSETPLTFEQVWFFLLKNKRLTLTISASRWTRSSLDRWGIITILCRSTVSVHSSCRVSQYLPISFHCAQKNLWELLHGIQFLLQFYSFQLRSPSPTPGGCLVRFHPEAVDKFSIVAFPLAFTCFNVRFTLYSKIATFLQLVYWWHYLSQTFEQQQGIPSGSSSHWVQLSSDMATKSHILLYFIPTSGYKY